MMMNFPWFRDHLNAQKLALDGVDYVFAKTVELQPHLRLIEKKLRSLLSAHKEGLVNSRDLSAGLEQTLVKLQRLDLLVDHLITLTSKGGEPFLDLELEEVNLCDLTAAILNDYVDLALFHKCNLTLSCPDLVIGHWDKKRLHQAVTELVSNAIIHAPGSFIEVRITKSEINAILEVIDQGPGIPFSQQAHVFERYVKLDLNSSRCGVGLWIVRSNVEGLAGSVRILSIPGEGATFRIELPLSDVRH